MIRGRSTFSKLVTLAVISFIGYQYHDIALENVKVLRDVFPLIQTYVEMTSYTSSLKTYISEKGEMPWDLPEWLNQNFTVKTGKEPGVDYFNTYYEGDESDGKYILRSCGRDTVCHTEDDLNVTIMSIPDSFEFEEYSFD